jgi:hypothetical protein
MRNVIPPKEERKYPAMGYLFVPASGIELLFKEKKRK